MSFPKAVEAAALAISEDLAKKTSLEAENGAFSVAKLRGVLSPASKKSSKGRQQQLSSLESSKPQYHGQSFNDLACNDVDKPLQNNHEEKLGIAEREIDLDSTKVVGHVVEIACNSGVDASKIETTLKNAWSNARRLTDTLKESKDLKRQNAELKRAVQDLLREVDRHESKDLSLRETHLRAALQWKKERKFLLQRVEQLSGQELFDRNRILFGLLLNEEERHEAVNEKCKALQSEFSHVDSQLKEQTSQLRTLHDVTDELRTTRSDLENALAELEGKVEALNCVEKALRTGKKDS
tara:strand:+ start:450 stop:1337 length:888 start_codon:yes stop_codon:yes gene_type:complete